VLERVDLVRDGGEAEALRTHIQWSCYPEYGDEIEDVQRAIVLCACGLGKTPITIAGRGAEAAIHVAALDLESFVCRRMSARAN
jgi:hypothetical protein